MMIRTTFVVFIVATFLGGNVSADTTGGLFGSRMMVKDHVVRVWTTPTPPIPPTTEELFVP